MSGWAGLWLGLAFLVGILGAGLAISWGISDVVPALRAIAEALREKK